MSIFVWVACDARHYFLGTLITDFLSRNSLDYSTLCNYTFMELSLHSAYMYFENREYTCNHE